MGPSSIESQLLLAIQAIQKDPKLTIRAAANIYNVPRVTLGRRLAGKPTRPESSANLRKLTNSEESAIVQYIIELDLRAFPPRISAVEDMANLLLAIRNASDASDASTPPPIVGVNWAPKFIKRQPQLRMRLNRRIDYQRVQNEDPAQYKEWFQLVRNIIAKYGVDTSDIYNFDETGFAMGLITSTGMVVTSSERKGRPRQTQPGNREWATVIQAVRAEGYALPPYLIMAGKTHLRTWYEDSPFPPDWRIAVTENGWTTNERGLKWIQHFNHHTSSRTKGSHRLLILDGHESHHSVEFELYAKENNIVILYMPPHSSHRLQPLDVGCFGPLKAAYSRQIEGLMKVQITHISKVEFFYAFYAAFQKAIIVSNIQGGFRGAGIVPLDPQSVISKLDVVLRTPSPPATEVNIPLPWTSMTPSTSYEATSQSDFIKNRVSNHQNSSPTTIHQAIDQLAKGTQGIMHEVALLRAEVQSLREANSLLSKRRRVKKQQLRVGGSLTAQESKDLIAQRDADEELRMKRRQDRAQRRGTAQRVTRCRSCGKTGHNARSCVEDAEKAAESTIEVAN
jgi:hypothetical protein